MIWIAIAFVIVSQLNHPLKDLKINEFGDFVAGIFAPLAFIWLAYSVQLQSDELRLQRKELEETKEVLKQQKNAQDQLVSETAKMARTAEQQLSDKRMEGVSSRMSRAFRTRSNSNET